MKIRKFLIFFSAFWTFMTSLFLAFIAYGSGHQFLTRNWLPAPGTVLSSHVTVSHGSKSTTYGIDIHYRYTAAGQSYTSDRVRFLLGSSSDSTASNFVHSHPADSPITVYYNPNNPADSVLLQGLQGVDYCIILFMTPFTVVMVSTWIGIAKTFRKRSGFAGLRIDDNSATTRVRPSLFSIITAFGFGLGIAAFISCFIVIFTAGGFNPKIQTAQCALLLSASTALLSAIITTWLILTGRRDMILDDSAKSLLLPGRIPVPYSQITDIRITAIYQQSDNRKQQYPTYEVWIDYSLAAKPKSKKLAHWLGDLESAQRFALWLSTRTNTPLNATGECTLPSSPTPATS